MLRIGTACVLLSLLAAGCASPPPEVEPLVAPPTTLEYRRCAEIGVASPIPIEEARKVMPPGYEPEPFDAAGALGLLITLAGECESIVVDGRDLGPGGHAFFHVRTRPPTDAAGTADEQVVVLRHAVAHEEERTALVSWGHTNVLLADVSVDVTLLSTGFQVRGRVAAEGGFSIGSDGVFSAQPSAADGYSARFHDATGVPVLDAVLDGLSSSEGQGATVIEGAPLEGSHPGIAVYIAPDDLLAKMTAAEAARVRS